MDYLTHQNDQIIATLRAVTTTECDDAAELADFLDAPDSEADEIRQMDSAELNILLMYARLGRNMWIQHLWDNSNG